MPFPSFEPVPLGRRPVAVLMTVFAVMAASASAVGPGVAGAQVVDQGRPIDIGALCANVPAGYQPFTDAGVTFSREIACLFAAGVTSGTGDGSTFEPERLLPRDQMATLVANMMDAADALDTGNRVRALPPADVYNFDDVTDGVHADSIDRLADAGIALGGPNGMPANRYGPSLTLTRAQMASLTMRAIFYLTGAQIPAPGNYFVDDDGNSHERNINLLASGGVVTGTGPATYSPNSPITRGQTSAILTRSLALMHQMGVVAPIPA